MGYQQISKDAGAAHTRIERDAKATYDAAYAESLRQYEQDGDHAAFGEHCKAASDAYEAAIAPVWAARHAILEHIDD